MSRFAILPLALLAVLGNAVESSSDQHEALRGGATTTQSVKSLFRAHRRHLEVLKHGTLQEDSDEQEASLSFEEQCEQYEMDGIDGNCKGCTTREEGAATWCYEYSPPDFDLVRSYMEEECMTTPVGEHVCLTIELAPDEENPSMTHGIICFKEGEHEQQQSKLCIEALVMEGQNLGAEDCTDVTYNDESCAGECLFEDDGSDIPTFDCSSIGGPTSTDVRNNYEALL